MVLLGIGISAASVSRLPFIAFAGAGILAIFGDGLYALALTNVKMLGAITPIGGLSLLAGWLVLAIRPSQS